MAGDRALGAGDGDGSGPAGGLNSSFSPVIRKNFQLCIASIHAWIFEGIKQDGAVLQDGKSLLSDVG